MNMHEQDTRDRLIRVEGEVKHTTEAVEQLSKDLARAEEANKFAFAELRQTAQELVVSSKVQAGTLDRAIAMIETVGAHEKRITLLENSEANEKKRVDACDAERTEMKDAIASTTEKTNRIYWITGILWTLLLGSITIIKFVMGK